jgi:LmbE family N-acetylglucosaminyl deacetylase
VVSPHFDDAVLSCADLIASADGCSVLTIFSGGPARSGQISGWDRSCGFSRGDDVMSARAAEDLAALRQLAATQRSLGFSQYRAAVPLWAHNVIWRAIRLVRVRRGREELAGHVVDSLTSELEAASPQSCVFPLGVSHHDHRLTASVCLEVARRLPALRWLIYEDMPYALEDAAGRRAALAAVRSAGFELEPIELGISGDEQRKRAAVSCYGSQLRGLGDRAEAAIVAAERYHLLTPRVAITA